MPILKGKLKGELTAPELRRLIKEHNKLVSIKIPAKTDRLGLIKLIEDAGYKVNHEEQTIDPVKRPRLKKLKLPPAPVPKTAEEKAEAKKKKLLKAEEQETKGYESRKKKIDAVKNLRKGKVPKGSHEMPDGSIMKDKDMPKPLAKKLKLSDTQSRIKKSNYNSVLDFVNPLIRQGYKIKSAVRKTIDENFENKLMSEIILDKSDKTLKIYFMNKVMRKLGSFVELKK